MWPFGAPPPPPLPTVVPLGEEILTYVLPVRDFVCSSTFLLGVLLLSPVMYMLLNTVLPLALGLAACTLPMPRTTAPGGGLEPGRPFALGGPEGWDLPLPSLRSR